MIPIRRVLYLAGGVALCIASAAAAADNEKDLGWSDTAQLSFVATGGNSDSATLGFENRLKRKWAKYAFTFDSTGVRTETRTGDRTALGTSQTDFVVVEPEKEVSAENYSLKSLFAGKISERTYWNVGSGWERNRPSGVEARYSLSGGLGTLWVDGDRHRYRTQYDGTYTDQEDVVDDPAIDGSRSFAGLRLTSDWQVSFGSSSTYQNILIVDENLDDTDDLRADFTNSLSVQMTDLLGLKVSLQLLYDHQPAFEKISLFNPPAPGTPTGMTVLSELDELDTIFRTSLVMNF